VKLTKKSHWNPTMHFYVCERYIQSDCN
jgi:hypothetical protein